MFLQPHPVKNTSAMVDSPIANAICTPTPNICLDFPKHCSFMKEKQRVMAGFDPNPAKKYPNPTMFGESARAHTNTPKVPIAHEALIASFLPQLSAMYGITKNPTNDPQNSID